MVDNASGHRTIFAQDLRPDDKINGAVVKSVTPSVGGAMIAVVMENGDRLSFKAEDPVRIYNRVNLMTSTRIPRGFDATVHRPRQTEPVPIDTIMRYAELIHFAASTKQVDYVRADHEGQVFRGIVRAVVRDENGGLLFGGMSDDNYLRVTSSSGPELFVRIGLITAMFEVIE